MGESSRPRKVLFLVGFCSGSRNVHIKVKLVEIAFLRVLAQRALEVEGVGVGQPSPTGG